MGMNIAPHLITRAFDHIVETGLGEMVGGTFKIERAVKH